MPPRTIQPALDFTLRLADGCSYDVFGGRKIGIGGSAGDVGFALEAFPQLLLGLADVFADDVAAGGFIPPQISDWAAGGTGRALRGLGIRIGRMRRVGAARGRCGLTRNQAEDADRENEADQPGESWLANFDSIPHK